MGIFSFSTKKRVVLKKHVKKPPANIIKQCKKYKIKITVKRGSKRIYKKLSILKKQIKKARKKSKKKVRKTVRKRRYIRRNFRFGSAPFVKSEKFGYDEKEKASLGILDQSISMVTQKNNINRPPGFGLEPNMIPTYGTYAPFFGEKIPKVIPPNWNFMGQPDGSLYPVGAPFSRYTTAAFGKKKI